MSDTQFDDEILDSNAISPTDEEGNPVPVTIPIAPIPSRAAANSSGRTCREHSTIEASASTSCTAVTHAARPGNRAPVPWVPVASAPLIVWASMSPTLATRLLLTISMPIRSSVCSW